MEQLLLKHFPLQHNHNHHICQNGIFIIIPQHIIHIKECSSDFEMKVMHILPDFLCALPITPDLNLLKQTASTPCLQLQEKDSEEIITHSSSKHKYTQLLTRNNAFNF